MVDKGWLVAASALVCAPVFAIDTVKLDRFQTGIAIIEQTGQAKWVDDTTLLVTTPIEPGKYDHWNAKVVAIDLQAKRVTNITAAGFLRCANPRKHYFVVAEGSHEKTTMVSHPSRWRGRSARSSPACLTSRTTTACCSGRGTSRSRPMARWSKAAQRWCSIQTRTN